MENGKRRLKYLLILSFLLPIACATSLKIWKGTEYETITFRKAYANSHIVTLSNGKFLMIDSGGYDQAPELEASIIQNSIDPKDIVGIVITHGHWDHAAGAKYFQDKYDIPVIAGEGDKEILKNGNADKLCPTSMLARWRVEDDEAVKFTSPKVDYWISEETSLKSILGIEGNIIPIPSHTSGSLVVVVGKNAYVGDLFRGSVFGDTPEVHFYICDTESNRNYIKQFLFLHAAEAEIFFPGHFGPSFSRAEVESAFDLTNN